MFSMKFYIAKVIRLDSGTERRCCAKNLKTVMLAVE